MLLRLLAILLPLVSFANYTFLGQVTRWQTTDRGAVVLCDGGELHVQFQTAEILRVTLVRPNDPEPLLYDALAANFLTSTDSQSWDTEVSESQDRFSMRSSAIAWTIDRANSRMTIWDSDGAVILRDDSTMAYGWDGNEVRTWKQLAQGEKFFGLGLKGGGLDKRGRELQMWNSDIPAYQDNTDPLYQSVPFYIGVRDGIAYGVYFNNSYRTKFNFGAGQQRYSSFSAEDGALDYFFIYGPTIRDVVRRFSDLTGRIELPPLWALGYQQCRWSYYPESEVRRIAQTFREKDIPCDVIYLDIHYMDGYRVFTWDSTRFPQPKKMIDDLAKTGFKLVPIIDPGVKADWEYKIAREGLADNHFVRFPDGTVHVGEVWPGPSYFPDFSRPKTRTWWGRHIAELRKLGLRGFWNDMNEPACWGQAFPLETVFDDSGRSSSHKKMHNLYALHMAQATREELVKAYPNERPFILTRAGFAGMQKYSAAWTGDNVASEDHLELGIRMMLGMGLSGQPFVGMDIGGFIGTPSPELFARWIQVGAVSPFCRTHTHYGSPDQEPWSFGENIEDINRKFIKLRYELLPYLYTLFYQSSVSGEPIWRPMFYEVQDDPMCYDWGYQQQFMLGSNVLVAPVTREKQYTRKVYLPAGRWVDWNTDRVYEGRQEVIVDAHLDWLPMFLREGSIVIRRDAQDFADQRAVQQLIVDVYGSTGKTDSLLQSTQTLIEDDGKSFDFKNGRLRETLYEYLAQEKSHRISRRVATNGYTLPDRSLTVVFHGVAAAPDVLRLNDAALSLNDSRISFDPDRRRLEIHLTSEFSFQSFEFFE